MSPIFTILLVKTKFYFILKPIISKVSSKSVPIKNALFYENIPQIAFELQLYYANNSKTKEN